MAHFSTSCSAQMMATSPAQDPGFVRGRGRGRGIFFVAATSLVYVVSEWFKYELMPSTTSPSQPLPIRLIEWGPNFVTKIFALAGIAGTLALLVRNSCRLYRKPSQCSSSTGHGRLIQSACSGVGAAAVYFLGVMATFALWRLNFWLLQMGVLIGAQYALFRLFRFSRVRRVWPCECSTE